MILLIVKVSKRWTKNHPLGERIRNAVDKMFFFNFIIRTAIESYFLFTISSFLNVTNPTAETKSEIVSLYISYVALGYVVLLPFFVLVLLNLSKAMGRL